MDRRIGLIERLAACFDDHRDPLLVRHSVKQMVAQRVYGLALGYEDLERRRPAAGRSADGRVEWEQAGGRGAIGGQEHAPTGWSWAASRPSRHKKIHCRQEAIDKLLVEVSLEAHAEPPERIVLDLDVTELPVHGHQEGRFFHGYYDEYCYLPLSIFAGEPLLCARLRTGDQDASAGALREVERIVGQIRSRWVRGADRGACRFGFLP